MKEDDVDHGVGIRCLKKRGDEVAAGEPLAEIHARDQASAAQAELEYLAALELTDEQVPARPVLLEVLADA
jgi:thymidine phosphorylase